MSSKLFVLAFLLGIVALSQCQWTTISPSDWPRLVNDVYFKAGFTLCKNKIVDAGKVFKQIYVIRLGPGIEYTLNDTENNVHLCSCVRVPAPTFMNVSYYAFFPLGQRKEEIGDTTTDPVVLPILNSQSQGNGDNSDVSLVMNGLDFVGMDDSGIEIYEIEGGENSIDEAEANLAAAQAIRD